MIWYYIWEWVLIAALGVFVGLSFVVLLGGIGELYQMFIKKE